MTLTILSAHKIPTLFYYIKVRGLGWQLDVGYAQQLQPCDSSTRRVGRGIAMLKHGCMISVANYIFYRIKKVFWQCSDIIVSISVFIENDKIANTVKANDPQHHCRNDSKSLLHPREELPDVSLSREQRNRECTCCGCAVTTGCYCDRTGVWTGVEGTCLKTGDISSLNIKKSRRIWGMEKVAKSVGTCRAHPMAVLGPVIHLKIVTTSTVSGSNTPTKAQRLIFFIWIPEGCRPFSTLLAVTITHTRQLTVLLVTGSTFRMSVVRTTKMGALDKLAHGLPPVFLLRCVSAIEIYW